MKPLSGMILPMDVIHWLGKAPDKTATISVFLYASHIASATSDIPVPDVSATATDLRLDVKRVECAVIRLLERGLLSIEAGATVAESKNFSSVFENDIGDEDEERIKSTSHRAHARTHMHAHTLAHNAHTRTRKSKVILPSHFQQSEKFLAAWKRWNEARPRLTAEAKRIQLERIASYPADVAAGFIDESIEKGWARFYPREDAQDPELFPLLPEAIKDAPGKDKGVAILMEALKKKGMKENSASVAAVMRHAEAMRQWRSEWYHGEEALGKKNLHRLIPEEDMFRLYGRVAKSISAAVHWKAFCKGKQTWCWSDFVKEMKSTFGVSKFRTGHMMAGW